MKKVLHEKSVHEKSVSFVISQKNLFVLKISKNIFLAGQEEEEHVSKKNSGFQNK